MPLLSRSSGSVSLFDIRLNNVHKNVIVLRGSPGNAASVHLTGNVVLSLTDPLSIKRITLKLYSKVKLQWTDSSAISRTGAPRHYRYETTLYEKEWPNLEMGSTLSTNGSRSPNSTSSNNNHNGHATFSLSPVNSLTTPQSHDNSNDNSNDNNHNNNSTNHGTATSSGSRSNSRNNSFTNLQGLTLSSNNNGGSSSSLSHLNGFTGSVTPSASHTLAQGNHEFPFETIIPGSLDESVEGLEGGQVIYKLVATIERGRFNNNIVAKKHVRVVRTLGSDVLELSQSVSIDNTWPKKIDYSISVPNRAIALGSIIFVSLVLSPLVKGLKLGNIKIRLVEQVHLAIPGGITTSYDRVVIDQLIPATEDGYADSDVWKLEESFALPASLAQCTQDCVIHSYIKVSHKLKFAVSLKNSDGHTSELRASLPVYVFISPNVPVAVPSSSSNTSSSNNNSTALSSSSSQRPSSIIFDAAGQTNVAGITFDSNGNPLVSSDLLDMAAPPNYEDRIYDRLWSDIPPVNLDSPAPSGSATPLNFFARSRRNSDQYGSQQQHLIGSSSSNSASQTGNSNTINTTQDSIPEGEIIPTITDFDIIAHNNNSSSLSRALANRNNSASAGSSVPGSPSGHPLSMVANSSDPINISTSHSNSLSAALMAAFTNSPNNNNSPPPVGAASAAATTASLSGNNSFNNSAVFPISRNTSSAVPAVPGTPDHELEVLSRVPSYGTAVSSDHAIPMEEAPHYSHVSLVSSPNMSFVDIHSSVNLPHSLSSLPNLASSGSFNSSSSNLVFRPDVATSPTFGGIGGTSNSPRTAVPRSTSALTFPTVHSDNNTAAAPVTTNNTNNSNTTSALSLQVQALRNRSKSLTQGSNTSQNNATSNSVIAGSTPSSPTSHPSSPLSTNPPITHNNTPFTNTNPPVTHNTNNALSASTSSLSSFFRHKTAALAKSVSHRHHSQSSTSSNNNNNVTVTKGFTIGQHPSVTANSSRERSNSPPSNNVATSNTSSRARVSSQQSSSNVLSSRGGATFTLAPLTATNQQQQQQLASDNNNDNNNINGAAPPSSNIGKLASNPRQTLSDSNNNNNNINVQSTMPTVNSSTTTSTTTTVQPKNQVIIETIPESLCREQRSLIAAEALSRKNNVTSSSMVSNQTTNTNVSSSACTSNYNATEEEDISLIRSTTTTDAKTLSPQNKKGANIINSTTTSTNSDLSTTSESGQSFDPNCPSNQSLLRHSDIPEKEEEEQQKPTSNDNNSKIATIFQSDNKSFKNSNINTFQSSSSSSSSSPSHSNFPSLSNTTNNSRQPSPTSSLLVVDEDGKRVVINNPSSSTSSTSGSTSNDKNNINLAERFSSSNNSSSHNNDNNNDEDCSFKKQFNQFTNNHSHNNYSSTRNVNNNSNNRSTSNNKPYGSINSGSSSGASTPTHTYTSTPHKTLSSKSLVEEAAKFLHFSSKHIHHTHHQSNNNEG